MYARLVVSVTITGKENIPRNEGFLLIANHLSYFDPFLIAYSINKTVHFLAMEELFRSKLSSFIMRQWHTIPVKRDSADRTAIRESIKLLASGKIVGIFPQGGIDKDNTESEFQTGAAMLAIKSGKQILPVCLAGTRHLYKPFSLKRRSLSISFRVPFTLEKPSDSDKKNARLNAIHLMHEKLHSDEGNK
jgi:1-acyl-sn-glycerol-3-phosphate acyltransferase